MTDALDDVAPEQQLALVGNLSGKENIFILQMISEKELSEQR